MKVTIKMVNERDKSIRTEAVIVMLDKDRDVFVLRNVYFTKFESILKYGIIFLGGVNDSNAVFKIQKKV
jgi:hypothetical protein